MAITTETVRVVTGPTITIGGVPYPMTLKATIDGDGYAADEVECSIGDIVFTCLRSEVTQAVQALGELAPVVS